MQQDRLTRTILGQEFWSDAKLYLPLARFVDRTADTRKHTDSYSTTPHGFGNSDTENHQATDFVPNILNRIGLLKIFV